MDSIPPLKKEIAVSHVIGWRVLMPSTHVFNLYLFLEIEKYLCSHGWNGSYIMTTKHNNIFLLQII